MKEAAWTVEERAEIARDRREGFVPSPEFFRRAKLQTAGVAVGLGILGLAISGLVVASTTDAVGFLFLSIAVLALGSIPLARHWEKRQEARVATEPEMRAALGHDGRLVSLVIRQGEAPTGEDWGMLWFEDGRLYFAGRRTSFGLVPDQARDLRLVEFVTPGVRNRVNLRLRREGPVGPIVLSLTPFVSRLANSDAAVGALMADLDRWQMGRVDGEGQWPPLALGPCAVSERRLLARVLAVTLLGPILPALLLLAIAAPLMALAAFVLGMVVALAPGNTLARRAWWSRRRLRRLG